MTWHCLKENRKKLSKNDKLGRVGINPEKTLEHDFIIDVGMRSVEKYLVVDELIRRCTSLKSDNWDDFK